MRALPGLLREIFFPHDPQMMFQMPGDDIGHSAYADTSAAGRSDAVPGIIAEILKQGHGLVQLIAQDRDDLAIGNFADIELMIFRIFVWRGTAYCKSCHG